MNRHFSAPVRYIVAGALCAPCGLSVGILERIEMREKLDAKHINHAAIIGTPFQER